MTKKKFIYLSALGGFLLLGIWGIILAFLGEASKIPLAIGSFVVGWYMQKIYERAKEVVQDDIEGRYDHERSGGTLRAG